MALPGMPTSPQVESSRWEGEVHIAVAYAYADRVPIWLPIRADLPRLGGEIRTEPLK